MPEDQRDKATKDELEDLYRKVAQDDSSRDETGQTVDLSSSYAILQVHPDATLIEIAEAYNQLKDTWREDRFPNVEAWQEKSRNKLAEVRDAYEKILSNRQYEIRNDLLHNEPEMPGDAPLLTRPDDEIPDDENIEDMQTIDRTGAPPSRKPWGLLIAGAIAVIAMLIIGLFVWPTIYRFDVIKAGDKIYPLRINRLTSGIAYFNGKDWSPPPVPIDTPAQSREQLRPALSAPAAPTVMPPDRPAGERTATAQKPAEKDIPAVIPKKKAVEEKAVKFSKSAPAAPSEPPRRKVSQQQERRVQIQEPAKAKIGQGGAFSIQLKAFQDEEKARNYMQGLKSPQGTLRIQKTLGKDKTVWYRVLLGQFKTRDEAIVYIQKKKIQQTYPGSFIQNTGKGA